MVKSGDVRLRLVKDLSGILESLIVKMGGVLNNSTKSDEKIFFDLKKVLSEYESLFRSVFVKNVESAGGSGSLSGGDKKFFEFVGSRILLKFSEADKIIFVEGRKNQSFDLARSIIFLVCVSFIRAVASNDPRGQFLDVTESLIAGVDSLKVRGTAIA